MTIVALVCLGLLCLGLGVLYSIFSDKEGAVGLSLAVATPLAFLLTALVMLNLFSIVSLLSIFLPLAFAFIIIALLSSKLSANNETKKKIEVCFFVLAFASLLLCSISLSEFGFLPIIIGALVGLSLGFLIWGVKGYKNWATIVLTLVFYMVLGCLLGSGIQNILASTHLLVSILFFAGAALLLVNRMIGEFAKQGKIIKINKGILILGLLLILLSIYFL